MAHARVPLRDVAAIAGVGYTEFSKASGQTTQTLALRAIRAALDDAGLTVADVDGLACHRVGDSVAPALVAQSLGIRDPKYLQDAWGGGSSSGMVVTSAAMAVACGLADVVVCWRALNARSGMRMGGTGMAPVQNPAQLVDTQYTAPQGLRVAAQSYAMVARAYMDRYGVDAETLGHVPITQREYARRNDRAMMREPLTMEQYLASRWIAEPLRLFDACLETDVAVAVVVTSAERARDLRQPPVLIRGGVFGGGHTLLSNGHADLTESSTKLSAERLWAQCGIGPDEVDFAEIYDAYSPIVLIQLDDFGFTAPGEAGPFVASGGTRLGGRLPVNTHGGFLSEGYAHGMNHVSEAVLQLRGQCGDRQVEGAEVGLVTSAPGYIAGASSALVLRKDG
jgi:acetyl-CoA acetyltransferase